MPLLDHFQPTTKRRLPWTTMAQAWGVSIMGWLNRHLPRDEFRAEINFRLGPSVEADVAELREDDLHAGTGRNGAVATLEAPPAILTLDTFFPDDLQIEIKEEHDRSSIVGVIELVSPSNKDRPSEREAFVAKCATYLRRGIGLIIVDVVTRHHFNLHNELLRAIGPADTPLLEDSQLYVAGYRAVRRRTALENQLEIWPYSVSIAQPLPSVPFGLRGGPVVVLDLEGTYTSAIESTGL